MARAARDPAASARSLPEAVISQPCAESQSCGAHRDCCEQARSASKTLAGVEKALVL